MARKHPCRTARLMAGMACVLLAVTGCAHAPRAASTSVRPLTGLDSAVAGADADYRVAPGDTIELHAAGQPPRVVTVGCDGACKLPCGRVIQADRRTAAEIELAMCQCADDVERAPRVKVRQCGSQFLFVFGPESESGPKAVCFRGAENVGDLLHRLDYPNRKPGYRVRVVRPGATVGAISNVYTIHVSDENKLVNAADAQLPLQPNDYVYVEKNEDKPSAMVRLAKLAIRKPSADWLSVPWGPSPAPRPIARR